MTREFLAFFIVIASLLAPASASAAAGHRKAKTKTAAGTAAALADAGASSDAITMKKARNSRVMKT